MKKIHSKFRKKKPNEIYKINYDLQKMKKIENDDEFEIDRAYFLIYQNDKIEYGIFSKMGKENVLNILEKKSLIKYMKLKKNLYK